jgi:BirA family biotin operon repressor/biotin-[acetyl-CoA-carboxylase] ligase
MTGSAPSETLRLIGYDRLGSTNDEAKRLAEAGAPAWTVISARTQSAGRGRRGKVWQSPPGNLYSSVILRPTGTAAASAQLGFAAALAVGEALAPRLPPGCDLRYKWPNDVLADGAKIAGILLESAATSEGSVAWLVAGIGINVASHPLDTPYPATSLAALGAGMVAPEVLLRDVAESLRLWVEHWEREGFEPVRRAWLERALGLGGMLGVRLPRESLTGRFVDLDRDGTLLLETETGPRRIAAGEIFLAAA